MFSCPFDGDSSIGTPISIAFSYAPIVGAVVERVTPRMSVVTPDTGEPAPASGEPTNGR